MECVKKELSWKFVKCQKWMRSIFWLLFLRLFAPILLRSILSIFFPFHVYCVLSHRSVCTWSCIHSCLPFITYFPLNWVQNSMFDRCCAWRDHFLLSFCVFVARWNERTIHIIHYYIILINSSKYFLFERERETWINLPGISD